MVGAMDDDRDRGIHAVTGAFGYSGKYIAQALVDAGEDVITLTNSPDRGGALANRIRAYPLAFHEPDKLAESLRGVSVLYNTYWVRFNHKDFSYAQAVENSITLFKAAKMAGLRKVVHVSITNPSKDSPLEYFRGKAVLESELMSSGLGYAILRPTVLFGKEDILINNLGWMLRTFPIFPIFGDGRYRLQPIYVEDLAQMAVREGNSSEDRIINAIGPETFTYRELVSAVEKSIGVRRLKFSVPPLVGYAAGTILAKFVNDVIVTRDEIEGLMSGLLCVDTEPTGATKLSAWIQEHAHELGINYASELARRKNRSVEYGKL